MTSEQKKAHERMLRTLQVRTFKREMHDGEPHIRAYAVKWTEEHIAQWHKLEFEGWTRQKISKEFHVSSKTLTRLMGTKK